MKSFKVREGKTLIDGILYGETPQSNPIMGKWGRIASINIGGRQFFPLSGTFDDGTTPIVKDSSVSEPTTQKRGKSAKTELKESSSSAVDESGKLVKVKRTKKK